MYFYSIVHTNCYKIIKYAREHTDFAQNVRECRYIDVSSPQTANRDHSQWEGKMGIGTTNQGRVNKPAGQWEPGGKDATLMPSPPPPLESCLGGQGGGLAERGKGESRRAGKDLIGSRREHSC